WKILYRLPTPRMLTANSDIVDHHRLRPGEKVPSEKEQADRNYDEQNGGDRIGKLAQDKQALVRDDVIGKWVDKKHPVQRCGHHRGGVRDRRSDHQQYEEQRDQVLKITQLDVDQRQEPTDPN